MPSIIGVPREIAPGERRVALVPDAVRGLVRQELTLRVERGAGASAGFRDADYEEAGAELVSSAAEILGGCDIVLKVSPPESGEVDGLRAGTCLISLMKPLDRPELAAKLAAQRVSTFAMEFMPRITRAQSMDALSSQSTISGYKAVLLAADALPRIFPMLVTAAGTLQPAKVLVIGAGVAGLQALGTAKRLGGVTSGYDTREAVRDQVQSLGARFVELDLDTGDSEDAGGYAKAQSEAFYEKQRVELGVHVSNSDVVITTALVPGQPAPFLITDDAVRAMREGSVIVDLAAEKGGNCELTRPDEVAVESGVTIIGHTNLPAQVPAHASQMYAKNLTTFLDHLLDEGAPVLDLEDEITSATLIAHEGEIRSEAVKSRLGGGGES